MAEKTTPPTENTETAPPATPPTQPAASPIGLDPGVYAPDGKTWKSKFNGAEGTRLQVENARDQMRGRFEQQVRDLEQQLRETQARIGELENATSALTEQVNTIPQLQSNLDDANKQAAEAKRLRTLMKHPSLLTVRVEEQREVEGQEEPETVTLNPFLALIENTTLEGEALDRELGRLASVLSQMPSVGPPAPVVEGAVPAPVTPDQTTDVAGRRAEAMRWHALKIAGQSGPDGEDPAQMEQEAWNTFYEAQAATS